MSLAAWFFPLLILFLGVPSPDRNMGDTRNNWRQRWDMLLDTLGLLPWIFSLLSDEPLAAWLGFEILALILVADQLWSDPSAVEQEAWFKLSTNWFLSWLFIGIAAALAGIGSLPSGFLFPLPPYLAGSFRPILAASLFTVGLALKMGIPPLQQGMIDGMEAMHPHRQRRWVLTLRLALVYAVWQLAPSIWGALNFPAQQLFGLSLVLGVILACLVASVQAGVQRTLNYMGSLLVLPAILGSLLIDPIQGFDAPLVWSIWILLSLGFILLALVYRHLPVQQYGKVQALLWIDESAPVMQVAWQRSWQLWIAWGLCSALVLGGAAALRQQWLMACAAGLLALSVLTAGRLQIGIHLRRHGSPLEP